MDSLSSCYFCGTALNEPLQEYPVVPERLRDAEDPTTATLCPTCHRKLETVLDEVAAELEGDGSAASPGEPGGSPGDHDVADDEQTPGEPDEGLLSDEDLATGETSSSETIEDVFAEPEEAGTGDLGGAADEPDEPADEGDEAGDEGDVGDEGDESDEAGDEGDEPGDLGDQAADPGDESGDEPTAGDADGLPGDDGPDILADEGAEQDPAEGLESAMEPDVPDEFDTGGAGSGSATADEGDRQEETEATEDPTETTDAPPTQASDDGGDDTGDGDGTGDDTGDGEDSDDEASGTARTSVSALEYNKVMRLLQNREFPVDREEIETVAANAYGLSRGECAEVIDLAVDRGLIGEEGSQLVRPD